MPASEVIDRVSPQLRRPSRVDVAWVLVRLVLGIVLLALAVREVDWLRLASSLNGAMSDGVLLALLTIFLTMFIKIGRWRLLLSGLGVQPRSWLRLGGAFLVGQAANIVLPFRGGDVARIGWLSLDDQQDVILTTLSVALEKYLDLIGLLGLLLWLGPLLPVDLIERSRNWMLPLCVAATGLLVGSLWVGPPIWRWLRGRIEMRASNEPDRLKPWLARMDRWMSGPARLADLRVIVPLLLVTAVAWVAMLSTNLAVLHALGLPVDLRAGGLVLALAMVGTVPALMPGNVGPFYFFAMLGLVPFGIAEQDRVAFAVLLHALVVLPPLVLGGLFLAASRWIKRGAS